MKQQWRFEKDLALDSQGLLVTAPLLPRESVRRRAEAVQG